MDEAEGTLQKPMQDGWDTITLILYIYKGRVACPHHKCMGQPLSSNLSPSNLGHGEGTCGKAAIAVKGCVDGVACSMQIDIGRRLAPGCLQIVLHGNQSAKEANHNHIKTITHCTAGRIPWGRAGWPRIGGGRRWERACSRRYAVQLANLVACTRPKCGVIQYISM